MFLTDLSIKRPVVASVMSLGLVIFGLFTFNEIPTDELPDVQAQSFLTMANVVVLGLDYISKIQFLMMWLKEFLKLQKLLLMLT